MDTITIDSVTCRGQHMPRGYASVLATLRSLAKGNLASTTVSVVIRTPARNGLASVTDAGAAASVTEAGANGRRAKRSAQSPETIQNLH